MDQGEPPSWDTDDALDAPVPTNPSDARRPLSRRTRSQQGELLDALAEMSNAIKKLSLGVDKIPALDARVETLTKNVEFLQQWHRKTADQDRKRRDAEQAAQLRADILEDIRQKRVTRWRVWRRRIKALSGITGSVATLTLFEVIRTNESRFTFTYAIAGLMTLLVVAIGLLFL